MDQIRMYAFTHKLKMAQLCLLGTLIVHPTQPSLYGKVLLEKGERLEIDWTSLKVRFFGQGEPSDEGSSFAETEKKAWNNGLLNGQREVASFHKDYLLKEQLDLSRAEQSAQAAGVRVSQTTYSTLTEYFRNGHVRVSLESSLATSLFREDLSFRPTDAPVPDMSSSRFSGIVLRSKNSGEPVAHYRIVDEQGNELYSVKDVMRSAYEKNLMGRWLLESPQSRSDLQQGVGSKPISLSGRWLSRGVFEVHAPAWKEATKDSLPVLAHAKIVIIVSEQVSH